MYTADAAWEAQSTSDTFRHLLMSRRTVNGFDPNHLVSDEVLKRAIECAIAAPNRSGSEPWRFIKVGPDTFEKLQVLNARVIMAGGDKVISRQQSKPLLPDVWTEIPGWCVVTLLLSPNDPETELKDFRSTSCVMQNFMLSMWSEGVGSKWTEGPTQKTQQFADLVGIDTDIEKLSVSYGMVFPKRYVSCIVGRVLLGRCYCFVCLLLIVTNYIFCHVHVHVHVRDRDRDNDRVENHDNINIIHFDV